VQRKPQVIEPGGSKEGGMESGLLKIGIEGELFNALVSKIVGTSMGISTFNPAA